MFFLQKQETEAMEQQSSRAEYERLTPSIFI
jgi:hypothetical protein